MLFNDTGRNAALTGGIGNLISHIGAQTLVSTGTLPDDAGSQEAAGGSYARQAVTWAAAAAGTRDNSGSLSIPVPAGTYSTISYHTALSAGSYVGNAPINSTIKGVGTTDAADITANTITAIANGLANTNRVFISNVGGTTLAAPLAENVLYFVVGATTDTFQLSLTSGGAAIDITAGSGLYYQNCIPEVFASAGTLSIATGALRLDASFL